MFQLRYIFHRLQLFPIPATVIFIVGYSLLNRMSFGGLSSPELWRERYPGYFVPSASRRVHKHSLCQVRICAITYTPAALPYILYTRMHCFCSPHQFRTINYSDSRLEMLCETAWGLRTNTVSLVPLLKECGIKVTLEFFLWNQKPNLSKSSPPFVVSEDLLPHW